MLKRFHNTERARGAVKVERRGDILVRHRLERVDQEKARFTQKTIDIITSKLVVSPGSGLVPGQLKVCMAHKASAVSDVYMQQADFTPYPGCISVGQRIGSSWIVEAVI